MLKIFLLIIIAAIGFVVFRLIKVGRQLRRVDEDAEKVEFPADRTFKNIEDADFEDLSSSSDSPDTPDSPLNKPG